MKLYSELAEYYFSIEANHREIDNDINFVRSYLHGLDRPSIIDLGCGTGEHLNALKKFGVRCVGIDSSREMLDIATKRYPSGIEFITKNFTGFDYYNEFDAALCLFGSMVYLLNDKDVDNFFWNTWRSLKNGGYGIFEIWNSLPIQKIKTKPLAHISQTKCGDVLIERERGFNLIESIGRTIVKVDYQYRITSSNESKIINDTHIMRSYTLEEITKFIKANGFIIKNVFANSLKEKFNENSNKMLIIFQKEA